MKNNGALLLIMLIALWVVISPFIVICGMNFILETMEYKEIPYTLGTWFGSALIGMFIRLKVSSND